MLYQISVIVFLIGTLMYFSGAVLGNIMVRNALSELWFKTESEILKADFSKSLQFAKNVISAIYESNGKISILKCFCVALLLNGLFLFGIVLSDIKGFLNIPETEGLVLVGEEEYIVIYAGFVSISLIASFFNELVGYLLTRMALKITIKRRKMAVFFKFVVAFILAFFVLPLLLVFLSFESKDFGSSYLMMFIAPVITFATTAWQQLLLIGFLNGNVLHGNLWYLLIIPSSVSICFSISIVLTCLFLKNNAGFLSVVSWLLENIEAVLYKKIQHSGLSLCAISSGVITIASY